MRWIIISGHVYSFSQENAYKGPKHMDPVYYVKEAPFSSAWDACIYVNHYKSGPGVWRPSMDLVQSMTDEGGQNYAHRSWNFIDVQNQARNASLTSFNCWKSVLTVV